MDARVDGRGPAARVSGYMDRVSHTVRRVRPLADLTDQVALITGGSRGFGLLVARELAAAGCKLAICARDEAELAQAQAKLLERSGNAWHDVRGNTRRGMPQAREIEVLAVPCDVADREQIRLMVARVLEQYGRIDILVNNAGTILVTPLENTSRSDFESAMNTMFWGTYDVTMAVLPAMRERGYGRIVNVTSIGGKIGIPHLLPYCSAKFAATGFSEGLRPSLAGKNITVTTIVPGLMRTGSVINVLVKGEKRREVQLFSALASLPVISMDADRAARQAVAALRRGQAERILGMPAKLAVRAQCLFPNLTASLLGAVNRVLPGPVMDDGTEPTLSRDVPGAFDQPMLRRLTVFSRKAAERNNEMPANSRAGDAAKQSETWDI
ncbi:MAG: short-chain dehydrogenase/reductase [Chloroflexi bacterium]|nr:short-chain dehydrogenase/reductase [Chloroflexota bacterium]